MSSPPGANQSMLERGLCHMGASVTYLLRVNSSTIPSTKLQKYPGRVLMSGCLICCVSTDPGKDILFANISLPHAHSRFGSRASAMLITNIYSHRGIETPVNQSLQSDPSSFHCCFIHFVVAVLMIAIPSHPLQKPARAASLGLASISSLHGATSASRQSASR